MTKLATGLAAAALALILWSPGPWSAQAAPLSVHNALAGVKLSPVTKASHRQIRRRSYKNRRSYRKRLHRRYGRRRGHSLRYGGAGFYYLDPGPYFVERCRFLSDCPCRYLAQC